jgi:hypothetical protein
MTALDLCETWMLELRMLLSVRAMVEVVSSPSGPRHLSRPSFCQGPSTTAPVRWGVQTALSWRPRAVHLCGEPMIPEPGSLYTWLILADSQSQGFCPQTVNSQPLTQGKSPRLFLLGN